MSNRAILTLVRHGETPANIQGVWHGSIDTPLTERGRAQAERVAHYLAEHHADASAIYASPLTRAHDTASAISRRTGLAVELVEDLREYDLGEWEGLSYDVLHQEKKLWERMKNEPHFAPEHGESPLGATERFVDALRGIAQRHEGERVIVVAHGGVLSLMVAQLIDGHYSRWKQVMDNCAVSEMSLGEDAELLSFNHVEHLTDV